MKEQTLRSTSKPFDFESSCLVCGQEIRIEKENKKPKQYRKYIRNVMELQMKGKIVEICKKRNDDLGKQIIIRLSNIIDLVAVGGKYHLSCYKNLNREIPSCSKESGEKSQRQRAFLKLCEYMENANECQFSLQHLKEKIKSYCDNKKTYVPCWLKEKLQRHFGKRIAITTHPGKITIITLTDTIQTILTEKFYTEKCNSIEEKKIKIVKAASEIIREDIKKSVYNTDKYHDFAENMRDDCLQSIPETLNIFADNLLRTSQNNNLQRKSISICHAIISAIRPNRFLSPFCVFTQKIWLETFSPNNRKI